MSEFQNHTSIEIGSEKNFGIVFAVVFALIGLYPVLFGASPRMWALIISIGCLALAFVAPKTLRIPNKAWHKFGMLLGAIIAPVAMGLVYLLTIVPIGLFFKVMGKDLLNRKLDREMDSYWIQREDPVGSMKNQF